MKKITKILEYLLFISFIVIFIFAKNKSAFFYGIIPTILILLLVKYKNIKHFGIFLFLIALLLRLSSLYFLKVPIMDDFKTIYLAAKDLIANNIAFTSNRYFLNFSYQIGQVIYEGILLKIIDNAIFLKIVNCIITAFITLFIYLLSKRIADEKSAQIISLLYLIFLYPLYLNSILTNQHLSCLFILISIYLFTGKSLNNYQAIIIGMLLSLANFIRSESIVIIISILIFLIICFDKKHLKNIFIIIITYLLLNTCLSYGIKLVGLSQTGLSNNEPLWKFYVGLNTKYNGMYNKDDEKLFFKSPNKLKLVKERINYKLPILFLKKEVILYTNVNWNIVIANKINTQILNIIYNYNMGIYIIIFILFLIGLYPQKEEINKDKLFIIIILFVYSGIYLFIEISPRYSYILETLIFIIGSSGCKNIGNKLLYKKNWK